MTGRPRRQRAERLAGYMAVQLRDRGPQHVSTLLDEYACSPNWWQEMAPWERAASEDGDRPADLLLGRSARRRRPGVPAAAEAEAGGMNDALAVELVEAIAASPVALERLRELVGRPQTDPFGVTWALAYTPRTLAVELGRSERSIRAAIARGELEAVKRGRGWVISADAVAAWAAPAAPTNRQRSADFSLQRRSGSGPMSRALKQGRA